jgi:LmbE family N-acetylglucosaminyl deacetylase
MPRVLVLSPHPDDESIGCGGAILGHVARGDDVRVVFLTSGEAGGHGRSPDETLRVREREARAAAKILGTSEPEFWREPDGKLRVTPALTKRLRETIETFKPDVVYVTHEREMHPDHIASARVLRTALAPLKRKPRVLMYEVWTPIQKLDEIIDISEFMKQKIRAVRAYRSQCAEVGFAEAVLGLNRYRGEMHSWPGGDYAEAFTYPAK